MFRFVYMLSAMFAVGCAAPERAVDSEAVSFEGRPADPEAAALNYVDERIKPILKDPDSMKLELIPDSFYQRTCQVVFSGAKYKSWAIGVHINAKNSYGGFTGNQPYIIHFKDGEPIDHIGPLPVAFTSGIYKCPDSFS